MTRALNRPALRVLAPALAAAAALSLSGCQATSPIATDLHYDPADGVSASTGKVKILDLLVLGTEEGGKGRLAGTFVNEGTKPVTVTITPETGTDALATVEVPGSTTVNLAEEDVAVSKTAAPGAVMAVAISSQGDDAEIRNVPVLLPDHAYADMAPEGYTTQPREDRAPATEHEGGH